MTDIPFAGTEPPGGVNYGEFTFRTKQWVLARAAERVMTAVPCSAVVPVLTCFRVRVGEGLLELAATDMERTVLAASGAVDAQDGPDGPRTVFIPARKLQAILREAPETDVIISVKKNQAEVQAGGSWVLRLPDGSDYPELIDPVQLAFREFSRERLLAALKAVRHVVCKDAGRPPLTQVDIRADGNEEDGARHAGHVTASDGTRFARAVLDGFPCDLTVPSSALDDLTRLLAASQADEICIGSTDSALVFRAGPVVLAVQRRSTPFPDMDRLLLAPARAANEDRLSVDKGELAAAVRRVRINADGDTAAIALELGEGSVRVVSRDKAGNSASEGIVAGWKGDGRVLCVNHVHLTEMLAAHPDPACEFWLGRDLGKRRSVLLLNGDGIIQVMNQMAPALVGY